MGGRSKSVFQLLRKLSPEARFGVIILKASWNCRLPKLTADYCLLTFTALPKGTGSMRSIVVSVLAAQIVLLAARLAGAQTAFEQLEQQVRTAVGQPAGGPPAAAAGHAAGQSQGYLGLIADDRQSSGKGIRIMEIVAGLAPPSKPDSRQAT